MTDRDAMTRRTKRNTATCTRLFLCYIKRRLRSIRSSIVVKGIIPFFIVVSLVGTLYQLLCPPPQEQTLLLIRQSPPEILLESPSSKVKSKPILVNDQQIFRIKINKNQNQNEGKIYSDQGSSQPQQQQPQQEPSVHVPFKHLDLIDPTLLVSVSGGEEEDENENEEEDGYYVPIDTAHRNGNIHMGTWIFVIDTNINKKKNATVHKNFHILLLKRGPQLVTCPNTWSLVGEHTYRNEEPMATVRRGLTEELGSRFVTELLVDSNTNNNNTNNKKKVGTIRNMTQFPIYFEQNWENGGRIDRQVTYLWLVELNIDVYVQQQQQQQQQQQEQETKNGRGIMDDQREEEESKNKYNCHRIQDCVMSMRNTAMASRDDRDRDRDRQRMVFVVPSASSSSLRCRKPNSNNNNNNNNNNASIPSLPLLVSVNSSSGEDTDTDTDNDHDHDSDSDIHSESIASSSSSSSSVSSDLLFEV